MSRHSHSNNNSEFEVQFQYAPQQSQMTPYQNEMYGMPPSQARHCHHRMMGQSNENVYNSLPQVGFNYGSPENQSSYTSSYQQDYNARWQQDYAASQARYQNQDQYSGQSSASYNAMQERMAEQQMAYQRHNQQFGGPPPEMYARMQAQEQAYAYHNQQAGGYPQQSYYAPSDFNPEQHRGRHCHRHHPRHHYGQQLGGGDYQTQPYYTNGEYPQQNNGQYQDTQYPRTYDGATYQAQDARQNAQIVAQVARSMGIDPVVAIAAMLVESGGNARAVGDHGSSFGLFQLHRHGELGNMSPQQAFDPVQNAQVALSHFQRGQQSNPGMMVANAQRPANRAAYAAKVNARLGQAQQLLNEVEMA